MKRILQPPKTQSCGQYYIAVLSGLSLKKVFDIIGHDRATTVKDIQYMAQEVGYKAGERLENVYNIEDIPNTCIIRLKYGYAKTGHWMLLYKGDLYNPTTKSHKKLNSIYLQGGRITSFLRLKKV